VSTHRYGPSCPCGSSVEHAAYMCGRRAARRLLGYSDLDDTPDVATESLPSSATWDQLIGAYERAEAARDQTVMKLIFARLRQLAATPSPGMPATVSSPGMPATVSSPGMPATVSSPGMPERVIPATPAIAAPSAFPAERACKGCKVGEFSVIGAGPFENGLCRYCAQLNTYKPIAAAVKRSVPAPAGHLRDETVADALRYIFHGDQLGTRVRLAAMMALPVWGIALYILITMVMAAQR
jgi:hypothetical protein